MAKGAATESSLGKLHSRLAEVFNKILLKYENELDGPSISDMKDEAAEEVLELFEPSPAMLSAIAKFLKDNDIGMDTGAVSELNSTARRLQDRRAARKAAGLNLSVVPHVETG